VVIMPWWLWMLFGLMLLILEVHTFGGFYLMFFGAGALLVGLVVALGVVDADWLEWLLFSVLSVATLALFRRPIMMRLAPAASDRVDSLIGEIAITREDIPSGAVGKADLHGSVWSARNGGATALRKDARCRVERVEGLTLWLRPE
jgi:membrane protein implicated in regulation of membrane protease activity